MQAKKLNIVLMIIIILLVGIIGNFIKKDYLNNEKIIVKAMTEGEYEDYITSLNQSHINYANYIQESKTKIASAITDMGVITSIEATPETMASNIRSIARDASYISYNNAQSGLNANNVQSAIDEIDTSLPNNIETSLKNIYNISYSNNITKSLTHGAYVNYFTYTPTKDTIVVFNINSVNSVTNVHGNFMLQMYGGSLNLIDSVNPYTANLGNATVCLNGTFLAKANQTYTIRMMQANQNGQALSIEAHLYSNVTWTAV